MERQSDPSFGANLNCADFLQKVLECRPRLVRFAERILENREEAEDVVQDSLLKAWMNLHRFRGEARLETWLCAITANVARSMRRKRPWKTIPLEYSLSWVEQKILFDPPPHIGRDKDISERCAELEFIEAIKHDLLNLDPAQQRVIQMCVLNECSYREAAIALNINAGTVKARLWLAKRNLAKQLTKRFGAFSAKTEIKQQHRRASSQKEVPECSGK